MAVTISRLLSTASSTARGIKWSLLRSLSSRIGARSSSSPSWRRIGHRSRGTPLPEERVYAPYVPTHAGADFLKTATPRYMKQMQPSYGEEQRQEFPLGVVF